MTYRIATMWARFEQLCMKIKCTNINKELLQSPEQELPLWLTETRLLITDFFVWQKYNFIRKSVLVCAYKLLPIYYKCTLFWLCRHTYEIHSTISQKALRKAWVFQYIFYTVLDVWILCYTLLDKLFSMRHHKST